MQRGYEEHCTAHAVRLIGLPPTLLPAIASAVGGSAQAPKPPSSEARMAARQQPGPISWPREKCDLARATGKATRNPSMPLTTWRRGKRALVTTSVVCNAASKPRVNRYFKYSPTKTVFFGEITTLLRKVLNVAGTLPFTPAREPVTGERLAPGSPCRKFSLPLHFPRLDPCTVCTQELRR